MNNFAIARKFLSRLTGAEIAEKMAVTPAFVSQLETGKRAVTRQSVQRIAEILDVSPAWLLEVPELLPVSDPLSGENWTLPIMRAEEIPGYGILYHVWIEDAALAVPVIIASGIQFTPADWQAPIPQNAAEIAEHAWIDPHGNDAIMLDGLPRVIG